MTELIKGMYDRTYYSGEEDGPFGLRLNQMREPRVAHNAGWYNGAGDRLGVGDLSVDDIENIALGLKKGQLFFVLPEHASYQRFFTGTDQDAFAPGPDHVIAEAMYIVAPCAVYMVDRYGVHEDGEEVVIRDFGRRKVDLPTTSIRRQSVRSLILSLA